MEFETGAVEVSDITPAPVPRGSHAAPGRWRAAVGRRLPTTLAAARFGLGPRAAVGICVVAALAVVAAVVLVALGRPSSATLSSSGGGSGAYASSTHRAYAAASVAAPTAPSGIEVDIEGKVHTPGLHKLPVGSRLADALAAAGGALPGVDLTSLDLAAQVEDGQQLRVGLPAAAGSSGGAGGTGVTAPDSTGATPSADNPVDLNGASATELDGLPGIGPALAARIVAWRDAHGPFASVSALGQVPGIGASKLASLTPLVHV